jgi:hypothetical protein
MAAQRSGLVLLYCLALSRMSPEYRQLGWIGRFGEYFEGIERCQGLWTLEESSFSFQG